jgi:hypothetical protein
VGSRNGLDIPDAKRHSSAHQRSFDERAVAQDVFAVAQPHVLAATRVRPIVVGKVTVVGRVEERTQLPYKLVGKLGSSSNLKA